MDDSGRNTMSDITVHTLDKRGIPMLVIGQLQLGLKAPF